MMKKMFKLRKVEDLFSLLKGKDRTLKKKPNGKKYKRKLSS